VNLDEYQDVAERKRLFFEKFPEGSIQPLDPLNPFTVETIGEDLYIVVQMAAYRDPHDPRPGIDFAAELIPGRTPYTRHSELMNASTSAAGRALSQIGFSSKKIATREEVELAQHRQAPAPKVERLRPPKPVDDPWTTTPEQVAAALDATILDPDRPSCKHGERVRKTGTNARGAWVGWYCPQPRGAEDRCDPIFGGK